MKMDETKFPSDTVLSNLAVMNAHAMTRLKEKLGPETNEFMIVENLPNTCEVRVDDDFSFELVYPDGYLFIPRTPDELFAKNDDYLLDNALRLENGLNFMCAHMRPTSDAALSQKIGIFFEKLDPADYVPCMGCASSQEKVNTIAVYGGRLSDSNQYVRIHFKAIVFAYFP